MSGGGINTTMIQPRSEGELSMPKKQYGVLTNAIQGLSMPKKRQSVNEIVDEGSMNTTQPKVNCQCQGNNDDVSMNAIQGLSMSRKR